MRRGARGTRRTRTPPRPSGCRDGRAEEGARSALPRRREHPRRHRAHERPRAATTSCSRSARVSACSRAISPIACASSTRSSSTARSSRRLVEALWAAVERPCSSGGTRSRSTSERWSRAPTKLVANLPYNIATPLVVETLEHATSLGRWCVMVQREVADRFFAVPRTKAYGAVSVLVQLAARKAGFHPVPPTVFRPRPRVESALVAFERAPIARHRRRQAVVEAAFAHRRKTARELRRAVRSRLAPPSRAGTRVDRPCRRTRGPRSSSRRSSSGSPRRFR